MYCTMPDYLCSRMYYALPYFYYYLLYTEASEHISLSSLSYLLHLLPVLYPALSIFSRIIHRREDTLSA
ncbi:hypothetical protein F4821DRAFT_223504 [Hypoxylon rubiginosum]|uniref:Uncharacterized protein n=1 Tax=Hypoxylon rubiginosum TaxID=110542 RepID=A0ACC0DKG4_9PEZI|nr:hypothetical protein F4821DRAFT_223504 [Hypoxylon rubiginosum]